MLGGLGSNSARNAKKIVPTLWVWGFNHTGQLGLGDINVIRSKPVQIDKGMAWSSVSGGYRHTLAIKTTGSLWAWGSNYYYYYRGLLGLGDIINRSIPTQVGTDTNWSSVSVGSYHTMAIKTTGTLWAWGGSDYYYNPTLGLGDALSRSSPVQVGADTDWSSVSAGGSHTVAIKSTGTMWAWGIGTNGRLGLGDTTSRFSPVQVGTDTNWSVVSAGQIHTLAIKSTGTLWAWGLGTSGRLGLGVSVFTNRSSPVQVGTDTNWSSVSAGGSHTMAIKSTGTLWAWGRSTRGQLGIGIISTSNGSPVQVGTDTNWSSVSAGNQETIAIKTTGSLWAWGYNSYGRLGIGNSPSQSEFPVQVGTDTDWSSVSTGGVHTMAIKSTGTLWVLGGANTLGQLGLGDTTNRSSPVQVGTDSNWASVSGGYRHTLARKTDNSLWAWGYNISGQLGLGNATNRSSPVQVGTDSNWSSVNAGYRHTLAIKTTGSLWAWGLNSYGPLGLGDIINRSSPVQVGTDTNWSSVSAGANHTLAIKTTGSLWAWGQNVFNGRLGLGDYTNRSSPVQVGTDTNWSSVSAGSNHTLAIKTTGSLWAWGLNDDGRLGLGDFTNRSSPVQVGTDTNWAVVSASAYHTLAIKTTGSLWAWGRNDSGQLGLGDTLNRSSPVQVGTDSNWSSVSTGRSRSRNTLARKTDGSLWSWGRRSNGQNGVEIIGFTLVPVQIQTATNWKNPSGNPRASRGVKISTTQNPTT